MNKGLRGSSIVPPTIRPWGDEQGRKDNWIHTISILLFLFFLGNNVHFKFYHSNINNLDQYNIIVFLSIAVTAGFIASELHDCGEPSSQSTAVVVLRLYT